MVIDLQARNIESNATVQRVELPAPPEQVTVDLGAKGVVISLFPTPEMSTGPPEVV